MSVSRALVVGSGCVGLRTAVELLKRNVQVILHSPRSPLDPSTCSVVAGGLWMPFKCADPRIDSWALTTLDELLPMAKDESNDLVEFLPAIELKRDHAGASVDHFVNSKGHEAFPKWTADPRLEFQHLAIEMLSWQNTVYRLRIPSEVELVEAGYNHAWFFRTPVVNSPKMLEYLLEEVKREALETNVETDHYFSSIDEMCQTARELKCDAVINCTGLGANNLSDNVDQDMVAGRGALLHFDRQNVVRRDSVRINRGSSGLGGAGDGTLENIHDAVIMTEEGPWGSESMPAYMIPRGNVLVCGGTFLKGDTEQQLREAERQQLLLNAKRLGIDIDISPPIGEMTGFRPYRSPMVRMELDSQFSTAELRFIHNYGHGGSGWTVNVGAAKACADLLLNKA